MLRLTSDGTWVGYEAANRSKRGNPNCFEDDEDEWSAIIAARVLGGRAPRTEKAAVAMFISVVLDALANAQGFGRNAYGSCGCSTLLLQASYNNIAFVNTSNAMIYI